MRGTGYTKLLFIWMAGSIFITLDSAAQTENVQPKFKQVFVYIPKAKIARVPKKNNNQVIDSLKNVILQYDSVCQKQSFQNASKDSMIDKLNQKIHKQQSTVNILQSEVSKYYELNSQTEKNNFILFVFNSIVCVLLLLLLIKYLLNLRNKKRSHAQKRDMIHPEKISESTVIAKQITITDNLEHLEKLGRLRNAGILTEEEFIFQKQLILKNSS